MAATERTKGRRAEAEVARIYESHGFVVRGLEAGGDHLAIRDGLIIHSEVKRHETLRLPLWARQASRDASVSAIPVVTFRRNRESWSAIAPARRVEQRLNANGYRAGVHYTLRLLNGAWWVLMPLDVFLIGVR